MYRQSTCRRTSETGPFLFQVLVTTTTLPNLLDEAGLHRTAATLMRVNAQAYDAFACAVGYQQLEITHRNAASVLYGLQSSTTRKRDLLHLCTNVVIGPVKLPFDCLREDTTNLCDRRIIQGAMPFPNVSHLSLHMDALWLKVVDYDKSHRRSIIDTQLELLSRTFKPTHLCLIFPNDTAEEPDTFNHWDRLEVEWTNLVAEFTNSLVNNLKPLTLCCHGITVERLPRPSSPLLSAVRYVFGIIHEDLWEWAYPGELGNCGARRRIEEVKQVAEMMTLNGIGSIGVEIELVDCHHCLDPWSPTRLQEHDEEPVWDYMGFERHLQSKVQALETHEAIHSESLGQQPQEHRVKLVSRTDAHPCVCCGNV